MDVCCWNLNICNTEIKPYYNRQVLRDWEGNLVKKPRGEHKVNIYESGVIGMIELIEMKWKGWLEWLDDLDALNQLKWPLRFADELPMPCRLKNPMDPRVETESGSPRHQRRRPDMMLGWRLPYVITARKLVISRFSVPPSDACSCILGWLCLSLCDIPWVTVDLHLCDWLWLFSSHDPDPRWVLLLYPLPHTLLCPPCQQILHWSTGGRDCEDHHNCWWGEMKHTPPMHPPCPGTCQLTALCKDSQPPRVLGILPAKGLLHIQSKRHCHSQIRARWKSLQPPHLTQSCTDGKYCSHTSSDDSRSLTQASRTPQCLYPSMNDLEGVGRRGSCPRYWVVTWSSVWCMY